MPAHPMVVPGNYQYVKRWHFALVVACVWAIAAVAGYGLYHWWYHSIDKTAPVFVVLVFLILCTVGGLLIAMVPNRPVASALGHRVHVGSAGRDRGCRRVARPLLLRMGQPMFRGAHSLLGLRCDPL